MPALVLFGRPLRTASDDLLVPAGVEVFFSTTSLICLGTSVYHYSSQLMGAGPVWLWCIGSLGLLTLRTGVMLSLVNLSLRGTTINTHPRRHAAPMLILKMALHVPELVLTVLGTKWIAVDDFVTSLTPAAATWISWGLKSLWCCTLVSGIVTWSNLNLSKRHGIHEIPQDLESMETAQGVYQQTWQKRFQSLGKVIGLDGHSALTSVGNFFADYFKDEVHLVGSDFAAALYVLFLRQKQQQRQPSAPPLSHLQPPPLAWITTTLAAHYMKFAAGIYGWPMYIASSRLAICGLLKVLIKGRYIPRGLPDNVKGDNSLLANTAVIQMVTGLGMEDIVLINYHNKLFEVPYYVALDHQQRTVVVAIRGTLSLEDVLTDLMAFESAPMCPEECGGVQNATAHTGMLHAARYLYGELVGAQPAGGGVLGKAYSMLQQRFGTAQAQEYSVVVCGHSLGAGVASVLAILLRQHPRYGPTLKCFAFSPPGGLLSAPAAEYARGFVCSVCLGDDIIVHLGIRNAYTLKIEILRTLRDLDTPKHKLFRGWFRALFSSLLGSHSPDLYTQHTAASWSGDPEASHDVKQFQMMIDALLRQAEGKRDENPPLYPAGWMIHIEDRGSKNSPQQYIDYMTVGSDSQYSEILLSDDMIHHHVPWVVMKALNSLQPHKSH